MAPHRRMARRGAVPDYVEAVQSFDWSEFYRDFHGEAFFEWLRGQLLDELAADVVLIDSRTGATEMGGVCTRQLADVVVAFCVPNVQNLVDTFTLTESFLRQEVIEARAALSRSWSSPAGSRTARSTPGTGSARSSGPHGPLHPAGPQTGRQRVLGLKLPYIPKYAYLENLAVGASDSAEELETAYRALTMNLALLAPDQSRLRKVSTPLVISPSGDRPTRGTCRRSGTSPSPRTPISPVANPSSPSRGPAARRGHGACGRRRHRPGRFRQDAARDRVRLPVPLGL